MELPKPFEYIELNEHLEKMHNGCLDERKEIINHCLPLVIRVAKKYFIGGMYEMDDLVSIGTIGLIKGVDTFNSSKGTFISYASRCIENEILLFLRKQVCCRNHETSLNGIVRVDKEGNESRWMDSISDDTKDFVSEYETKEFYSVIREIIGQLPEFDREMIDKIFGFTDDRVMKQSEVAKEMGKNQPFISRKLRKTLHYLKLQFEEIGVTEVEKGNPYIRL